MSNFEIEKNLIKKTIGEDVYDLLKDMKVVLAGGAITSIFSGAEINDFDLYFTDKEGLSRLVAEVFGVSDEEHISPFDLIVKFATNRSMLCIDKYSKNKLQFIHYKVFKDAHDIFNSFDFEHVMGAFDFATEEFIFHDNFFKSLAQRNIVFNPNTDFPIVSLTRVQKYKERSYKISKAQMLRVAFTIAGRNYDSWEKVKSECAGMYGVAPDDLFDETKPFSLEEVVRQLETVILNDKYINTKTPTFEKCVELMTDTLSENFKNWYGQFETTREEETAWGKFMTRSISLQASLKKYDFEEEYSATMLEDVVKVWAKPVETVAAPHPYNRYIPLDDATEF